MKKIALVVVVMAITALAGVAMAVDTNTLTVNANVVGTCKFNTATSTLNFTLDPSVGTDVTANTSVTYWCTKGQAASGVAAGQGANWSGTTRRMLNGAANYIPYTLAFTGDTQVGGGPTVPLTLGISGTVLGTDYTGATAGAYVDTVTLTLNP